MGNRYPALLFFLLCLFCTASAWCQQEEFVVVTLAEQEPAPGSEAASATPLVRVRFANPDDMPEKDQLLMELDRVDVSSLAQIVEGGMQFDPSSPLPVGNHEIRFNGKLRDGRAFQEITWSFTVPEAKTPAVWDFGLEPSATWEFGIQQEGENPDRNRFSSNIAVNSSRTGRMQSAITSNFQGQDSPGPNGENFDIANLTATFAAPMGTSVSLWDVQPNYDALLVSNLSRRGISFQQKLPFLNSGFDAFLVRSDSIFGFEHGLGLGDSNQLITGTSYFFSPLKNSPDTLIVRFVYLHGENAAEEGFNFGGFTRGSEGDAYGVAATSTLFNGQLRTEVFSAWSDFDFNAADDFSGNKDEAFLFRINYAPTPGTIRNRPSAFQTQLEVQSLGTFFKSLGNPFLVGDRLGFNFNANWSWGILGFTGGLSDFVDNVNDIEILPSVDNRAISGGFTVTPQGTNGPPALPSLTFNASRSEQESKNEPAAFLAVNNVVDTYGSVISWTRGIVALSLNLSYADNEDLNDRVADTDSKNATLGALLSPRPFINFGPSISFTRTADKDTDIDTDLWTYSLTAGFPILPDRLLIDGQASYSSVESSDFLNRSSTFSGTAQLSILLGQFFKTPGRQAFSVRLSYNRQIVDAPFIIRQKGLEIFGTLDVSWPF